MSNRMYEGFDSQPDDSQEPLSVSALTQKLKETIEGEYFSVVIAGEVTDLTRAHSGHCYFTLKDSTSQIRAIVWKNLANRLPVPLENGQEIVCHGKVEVYAPRGTYQVILKEVRPKGEGSLQQKLRQLQKKLATEGLFEAVHKKRLPHFPKKIAFVTSPSGAAIRDFLQVATRRWPGFELTIIPAVVQGVGAANQIARGIELANSLDERPEVLLVGRGGGSVEDLWCFNEEIVVRAVFRSTIPVVSAIGHEIDITLTDLVADVRALTPTEAAELVVPKKEDLLATLAQLRQQLDQSAEQKLLQYRQQLELLRRSSVFEEPLRLIQNRQRLLDELTQNLQRGTTRQLGLQRHHLQTLAAKLESLSPLNVLARGYSLTTHNGLSLTDTQSVKEGDLLTTRLASGHLYSKITKIVP
ncbi:MAG: exodeoxyribonuclease VII large subunit [Pirellulaceae bacterium]|nr:exodeoxyribonuclease VII large subunit [Pirellulaceae bacterium]